MQDAGQDPPQANTSVACKHTLAVTGASVDVVPSEYLCRHFKPHDLNHDVVHSDVLDDDCANESPDEPLPSPPAVSTFCASVDTENESDAVVPMPALLGERLPQDWHVPRVLCRNGFLHYYSCGHRGICGRLCALTASVPGAMLRPEKR